MGGEAAMREALAMHFESGLVGESPYILASLPACVDGAEGSSLRPLVTPRSPAAADDKVRLGSCRWSCRALWNGRFSIVKSSGVALLSSVWREFVPFCGQGAKCE